MHTRFRHLRAITRTAPLDNADPNPSGGGTGTPPAATPPADKPAEFDPSTLSPEAQAYIARREKAADEKARTTTRDNAAAQAEAKVRKEMADKLGLTPAQLDPATVAAELATERAANKVLRVETAVERVARKVGADEDLVVAKLARDGKLKGLDPESDKFADEVKALVDKAIADNPRLKLETTTATPPGAAGAVGSHSAPAGGEGGRTRPKSLSEALSNVKLS